MASSRHSKLAALVRGSCTLVFLCCQLLASSDAQFQRGDLDHWSEWSVWSPCSTTCGPGIETRTRHCLSSDGQQRFSGLGSRCNGSRSHIRVCAAEACSPDQPTPHEAACAKYNSRVFSGRQYIWEPFTHPPSPCKMACRARGQHFYANLAGRHDDGTPCGRGTAEAICVAGSCRKTGCDGIVASTAMRDNCGVCQGDGRSCSTISGIFTSSNLRRGLNDVINIPAGSTNINITELEPSRNLLLLQTFEGRTILTGGTRNPVSGEVSAAGTVFTYSGKMRLKKKERIYAPGPTNIGVKLKLLLRGTNPGIVYSFSVPTDKGKAFLQGINRQSQTVTMDPNQDSARDRLGVSGFGTRQNRERSRVQVPGVIPARTTDTTSTAGDGSSRRTTDPFTPDDSSESEDSDLEGDDSLVSSEDIDSGRETGEDGSAGSYSDSSSEDGDEGEEEEEEEEDEEGLDGEESEDEDGYLEEDGEDEDGVMDEDERDEEEEGLTHGAPTPTRSPVAHNELDHWSTVKQNSRDDTQLQAAQDKQTPSTSSNDYKIPRYSQSFAFGERYKSSIQTNSTKQGNRQQFRPETRKDVRQSGRVVSFGLKYVDDNNQTNTSPDQSVTIGSRHYTPNTDSSRRTYTTLPSGNSGTLTGRNGESTQRRDRKNSHVRNRQDRQRQGAQQQHRAPSTDLSSRSQDALERERLRRQRQHEAAVEARRLRIEEERRRYNQRVLEYQERVRRRQAEIARHREARRKERERHEAARARSAAQGGSRVVGNRQTSSRSRWRGSTAANRDSTTSQSRQTSPSTRRPIIRPYGEDGLYATTESSEIPSTGSSTETFLESGDKRGGRRKIISNRLRDDRYKDRTDVSANRDLTTQANIIDRVPVPDTQAQPDIIPRVSVPGSQAKPDIIPRVQGVRKPRPDIIPRVRSPGGVDTSAGGRPSITSSFSGGDLPAGKSVDDGNNVILTQSRSNLPRQTVDNTIDSGFGAEDAAYTWRISGLTECTMTCGGGVQQTVVVCVDTTTQAVVTDENCRSVQKPDLTAVKCNTRPCPAEWTPGQWSACSSSCGGGQRSRTLTCQARVSPTLNLTMDNSSCEGKTRPAEREGCGLDPCNQWRTGNWSQCSAYCGEGVRTRPVDCVSTSGEVLAADACTDTRPNSELSCDNGPCGKGWFYQEWPEECPVDCGEGEITRKIFCSGESNEVLPDERCDPNNRPDTTRTCRSPTPCGGHWFTGPWSKCDTPCGRGKKIRDVICVKSLAGGIFATVGEENCLVTDKPAESESCLASACVPEWYMTSWSQCSRTCGTGYRSRDIKCLSPEQRPSDECSLQDRPKTRDPCNTQRCSTGTVSNNQTRDSGSEASSDCVDQFPGCPVVKKARLCRYKFYRKKCCKSCLDQ